MRDRTNPVCAAELGLPHFDGGVADGSYRTDPGYHNPTFFHRILPLP
ncbi:MAG UNVERIFIED_CONTAM: hypothetical protein LVR18_21550 [Planctomycetaceae bacterium]